MAAAENTSRKSRTFKTRAKSHSLNRLSKPRYLNIFTKTRSLNRFKSRSYKQVDKKERVVDKKVLVLCQRKSSQKDKYVQEDIVPQIEAYVKKVLGNATIEYLTDGTSKDKKDFGADYKFALDNKKQSIDFIHQNKEKYDLIILNTCPLIFMIYKNIFDLLIPDGIMAIKTFGNSKEKNGNASTSSIADMFSMLNHYNKHDKIDRYFDKIDGSKYGNFVYKKVEVI